MKTHQVLKKYFDRKKSASSGFSMRMLAKKLDISPSFLSRVFSGDKPVPYKLLLQLKDSLDIENEVLSGLLTSEEFVEVRKQERAVAQAVESELNEWNYAGQKQFSILRQWFYLAILEYTTLDGYDGNLDLMSERLGITKPVLEIAVREMASLGLLVEVNGILKKSKEKVRWASANSHSEVRRFHDQMMTKAKEQMHSFTSSEDFAKRLITGITVTASKDRIEAAKRKLNECLHEIANDLTESPGTEVYQLAAQFFPLTKNNNS